MAHSLVDDDADILADIRRKLAERGEPADGLTDDDLREALRITLAALAREYMPDGGEDRPPEC
jgi:hypothetical protein